MFHRAGRLPAISSVVLTVVLGLFHPLLSSAQDTSAKKTQEASVRTIKNKTQPIYPALARHMNLSGVVKVELTIAPDGKVKSAKVLGGHPLLGEAALDAVKRWRYEPAKQESTEIVDIRFAPETE